MATELIPEYVPPVPTTYDELLEIFGNPDIEKLPAIWSSANIRPVKIPWLEGIPTRYGLEVGVSHSLRVNIKLVSVFTRMLADMYTSGAYKLIEDHGGAYTFRPKRSNPLELSTHTWGVAWDINIINNYYGLRAAPMPYMVVAIMKKYSFVWGGDFTNPDPMHFQYCAGY